MLMIFHWFMNKRILKKKTYCCLVFLAMLFFTAGEKAIGQGLEFGIKGGFTLGTPYGIAEEGAKGKLGAGPTFGVFIRGQLNFRWKVQAEFLYSKKGSTFKTPVEGDTLYKDEQNGQPYTVHTIYKGWVEGEFDNVYLDIPVVFLYRLNTKWNLLVGPQFSYLLKGKNKGTADIEVGDPENPFTTVEDEPFDQSEQLKKWDYGILLGGMYHLNNKMHIGLSVTTGLFSIYDKNYKYLDRTVRNIYLQASLGFKISKD